MSRKKLELYFHIPFCVRKCLYCDFLSAPGDDATKDAYMNALLTEVKERAAEYSAYEVDTVFIGGGTPSLVAGVWMERLLDTVRERYCLSEQAEITIEVNPGTVDEEKLRSYFGAGINRLSIGLQSAKDEELKTLGRIHTWQDFRKTYELAGKVGFTNINVDVMSALPGQTENSYFATLEAIMTLQPQPKHISAYSLIVEEGTPFYEMEEKGMLALPEEECERRMYQETGIRLAKHGYVRYEISNYAKEGYACRHNCGYWRRTDYVGFGIGAASLVKNCRFRNSEDLKEYLENPLECRCDRQELTREEQMEEFMFLGLRMTEGVSRNEFRQQFGTDLDETYGDVIERNKKDGLLTCPVEDRVTLTEKGMDVSNYVMAQFLLE